MTLAQRKAKLHGCIKTYEDRIAQYRIKHGPESFRFKMLKQSCDHKIASWKKEIASFGKKVNKVPIMEAIVSAAEEYCGKDLKGQARGMECNLDKYFVCKYLIDEGAFLVEGPKVLGISQQLVYRRRNEITLWLGKSSSNRRQYHHFRGTLRSKLGHVYEMKKQQQGFLDQNPQ